MDKQNEPTPADIGLERLIFFSDGVFAIAITLLALEIHVPARTPGLSQTQASTELLHALYEQAPVLFAFVISFLVIGTFWVGHHRLYRYLVRYDRRLLWLNLLFLMGIVLIPFASALLGAYGDLQIATILYSALFTATGIALNLAWWYATHNHRLIRSDLDPHLIRELTVQGMIPTAVFGLSILISFFSNDLARAVWLLLLVVAMARRSQ